MKTKIKSLILALTIAVSSVPFSGITANAVDLSESYTQEVDWSLWERFLKYDLCITDYDSLTDEQKELCEFIFVTERSANDTVICERARRQLVGYDVGERITLEQAYQNYDIKDYSDFYELSIHHFGEDYYDSLEAFREDFIEYKPEIPVTHSFPDIKHIDYNSDINEYWLDDEGTERIFTNGEAEGFAVNPYSDAYGYYKYNEETQEYDYESIPRTSETLNTIELDGFEYVILSDGTVALSELKDENMLSVTVPESVDGKTVTGIEHGAFAESLITDVILPDTIEYIAPFAFYNCDSLVNIKFPEGLDFIGAEALGMCDSLGDLVVNCPNLITSGYVFYHSNIDSLNLDIKYISTGCLNYTSCDSFMIGENTERIESWFTFIDISIPPTVKAIVQKTGEDGIKAENITIPPTVEIIGALSPASGWWGGSGVDAPPEIPLIEPNDCLFDSDTVINGYYNTEAHSYAVEWGLKFNPLDEGVAYGDINLDGEISVADAVLLQSKLVGKDVTVGYEADLAKDGIIDIFDMIEMRSKLITNS